MSYYWHLVLWDGERIPVKPENVDKVRDLMARDQDIPTPNRTIIKSNIKDFVETDIPVVKAEIASGLTEEAARAFKEPMLTEDGSVVSKWVKKWVTQRKFDSYYSNFAAYKRLAEEDGRVCVAFRLPVDVINVNTVEECTAEDMQYLKA